MRIHLYDFLNKNKKATIEGAEFSGLQIGHTIDDFSSCTLNFGLTDSIINIAIQGFDNIYVEDDDGHIVFGGIITGYNVTPTSGTFNCFDHRWVLTRLILDEVITISASDDLLDKVEILLAAAKAKREIPLEFDREGSAINPDYGADLRFEIGDNIGSSLQKIIQTVYARWAVQYVKDGDVIYGKLVVRSVRGVTPEGVGISRSKFQSDDGKEITLFYGEGSERSNMQDFNFVFDLSSYTSRTKVGAKIGDVSQFFDSPVPQDVFAQFEYFFGRADGFVTDYNANSPATAYALADINRTLPRQDLDVLLTPTAGLDLNCGDRVNVVIDSPLLAIAYGVIAVRIDAITMTYKDGYFEKRLFVNTMSPQKRTGTTGFLQAVNDIKERLDGLDKNYFNSTGS